MRHRDPTRSHTNIASETVTMFSAVLVTVVVLSAVGTAHAQHNNGIELATENKLEYQFFLVKTGALHFKMRAAHDAHIALTSRPDTGNPIVEVFIGGWSNSKSVIRRDRTKPDVSTTSTPQILSRDEYTGFWVRWTNGEITVEREGEAAPFLAWRDPNPFPVKYFGVSTGWGADGHWLIEGWDQDALRVALVCHWETDKHNPQCILSCRHYDQGLMGE